MDKKFLQVIVTLAKENEELRKALRDLIPAINRLVLTDDEESAINKVAMLADYPYSLDDEQS